MTQSSASLNRSHLKPNPFISLRDPISGKWRVVFSFAGAKLVEDRLDAYAEKAMVEKTAEKRARASEKRANASHCN